MLAALASQRSGTNGSRRVLTIEILNPVELAATRGRVVGIAGSLVPALTKRIVYDQTLKQMRKQLVDQGVVADVRLVKVTPAGAPGAVPAGAVAVPTARPVPTRGRQEPAITEPLTDETELLAVAASGKQHPGPADRHPADRRRARAGLRRPLPRHVRPVRRRSVRGTAADSSGPGVVAVRDFERLVEDGQALAQIVLADGARRDDVGAVEVSRTARARAPCSGRDSVHRRGVGAGGVVRAPAARGSRGRAPARPPRTRRGRGPRRPTGAASASLRELRADAHRCPEPRACSTMPSSLKILMRATADAQASGWPE